MARGVTLSLNEYYHLYNRGTDKRVIFEYPDDHRRFLALLYLCNQTGSIQDKLRGLTSDEFWRSRKNEPIVDIAAYCLMPNHFHIIAKEITEGGISKFMQKLTTGYTMYFNKRYERAGALLQGTFKANHVDDDTYLRYLIAYVHLNPIKLIDPKWKENGVQDHGASVQFLDNYLYSSYMDYCGKNRKENVILNMSSLLEYFDSPAEFKTSIINWLSIRG